MTKSPSHFLTSQLSSRSKRNLVQRNCRGSSNLWWIWRRWQLQSLNTNFNWYQRTWRIPGLWFYHWIWVFLWRWNSSGLGYGTSLKFVRLVENQVSKIGAVENDWGLRKMFGSLVSVRWMMIRKASKDRSQKCCNETMNEIYEQNPKPIFLAGRNWSYSTAVTIPIDLSIFFPTSEWCAPKLATGWRKKTEVVMPNNVCFKSSSTNMGNLF